MFWGLSTALDLYEEYLKAQNTKSVGNDTAADTAANCEVFEDSNDHNDNTAKNAVEEQSAQAKSTATTTTTNKSLNILIYGGSDPRHIIKTIAKRYTHSAPPELHFYIINGCVEIMARNLLLLAIALESSETLNLVNKTHLFMDVYGNTLIRPSSHHYVVSKAKTLTSMITDGDIMNCLAPVLCIDQLKYTERDGLENAFNFWQPKAEHVYNIEEYWTKRVRTLLGTRYDYRNGAFDWDLSMILKNREGQQICSQEYGHWRECGIAFVFPEYEQCKPNKTFAAGLIRNGPSFMHRGYLGDIQTGPFCAFGLRSREERMHNAKYGENDYRATDVTERNLLELFHELQSRSAYAHDPTLSRKYGAVKLLMGKRLTYSECDMNALQQYDREWIKTPGVKLHFASITLATELQNNVERWLDFFDVAFVSHNFFPLLLPNFAGTLRNGGLLLLETKLMTVERKESVHDFEAKLMAYAKSVNLHPVLNYQAINSQNMLLKYKKCSA